MNYELLAKSLSELIIDTCCFDLMNPSPILYENKEVKVSVYNSAYYDGSTSRGLIRFAIGDDEYTALIEYNSWGEIEGNILVDSLRSAVLLKDMDTETDSKFTKQMIDWKKEHQKTLEYEESMWDYYNNESHWTFPSWQARIEASSW